MPDKSGNLIVRLTMDMLDGEYGGPERTIDLSALSETGTTIHQGCNFLVGKVPKSRVDVWIVLESSDALTEEHEVPDGCLIFASTEASWPPKYFLRSADRKTYLQQFDKVYSPHAVKHPNSELTFPLLPWMVNANNGSFFRAHHRDLRYLRLMVPETKPRLVSAIVSAKTWTPAQRDRYRFMIELKNRLGESLDWYGNGVHPIAEKWDGLMPYKFTLALENQIGDYIATEKLWDPFLTFTVPIYWGSPRASDVVPTRSFISIDLTKPRQALQEVQMALKDDNYFSRLDSVLVARNAVLDEMSFLSRLSRIAHDEFARRTSENYRSRLVSFAAMKDTKDYEKFHRRFLQLERLRRRVRYATRSRSAHA